MEADAEEEVAEMTEQPEDSADSSLAEEPNESEQYMQEPNESEQYMSQLSDILLLPVDTLRTIEEAEGGKLILEKMLEQLQEDLSKIEEYEAALKEVTETMSQQSSDSERQLETLQNTLNELLSKEEGLQERIAALTQSEEVLTEQLEEAQDICEEMKEALTAKEMEVETVLERERQLNELLATTKEEFESKLANTESKLAGSQELVKVLSVPPPDIPGADRQELLRVVDRRQYEINQLSEEWKALSTKLVSVTAEKSQFQTRIDELVSEESAFKLKEKLLEQEKELYRSQNEWLNQELECKSRQLNQLLKERSGAIGELESQLSAKDEEIKHLSSTLETLRKSYTELEEKSSGYLATISKEKEDHTKMEELLRTELVQQARLSDLYQKGSEDAEGRVKELLGNVEKIQDLLDEVTKEKDDLLTKLDEESIRHEEQESEWLDEVESMKLELSHANDLVSSFQKKSGEVLLLSPAAAKASALLKSGMSLTQIYSKYVEATEELQQVSEEKMLLDNYIEEITQELAEKTPALQQLRRDHDQAMNNCNQLTVKLNALFEECETLRLESEDSIRQTKATERENGRLKQLVGDLGRQVKVLLKECEEARGGVASSSLLSHEVTESGDISSSSQVVSEQLVEFRSISELQEQNQRLLGVVRELSAQNEERERQTVEEQTKELHTQLETALKEIENLKDARERQKEMVQAIVNQRDMYRTLLAQATPIPGETSSLSSSQGHSGRRSLDNEERDVLTAREEEAKKALNELREQFTAYRKEKAENDSILQQQIDKLRDENSKSTILTAKLSSKLDYSKERYTLLDNHHKALKTELETIRMKNSQLSDALSSHQERISTTTNDLFAAKDSLSKLEVSYHSLKGAYDLLETSERQARSQYESLLKEQRGHRELLANLHTIQNNLEKSEFETKTRLGSQIEALEREIRLYKDKLHAEEERRNKMVDAYDTQVRDLEQKLSKAIDSKTVAEEKFRSSDDSVRSLKAELSTTKETLAARLTELKDSQDKVLRLEQDSGGEFRGKIRILGRQKADLESKVKSLESQLQASKEHADQFQAMSQSYEQQLQESNATHLQFKTQMEAKVSDLDTQMVELTKTVQELEEKKTELEEQLKDYTEETSQQVADLEGQIATLESKGDSLESELTSSREELECARNDIIKLAESVKESQSLYQHEIMQHGKSTETLFALKEQLQVREMEVLETARESKELQERLTNAEQSWKEKETEWDKQQKMLEERVESLTQQNSMLHEEAEKLSARLITTQQLQDSKAEEESADVNTSVSSQTDKSTEQLWEIIRYIRREKEIAETRRELAEVDNMRHKQQLESTQRQLTSAQSELKQLCENVTSQRVTALQHAEVMKKVENLNLLTDSNRLLREEKDRQMTKIRELEETRDRLEGEVGPLKETNRQLVAQKDALLAEKTALRNEVQRWNTRTNQLIEQYNKVDPEEYKKLLEEREGITRQMENLTSDLSSTQSRLSEVQSSLESTKEQLSASESKVTGLNQEMATVKEQVAQLTEDKENQQKLIGKLREVGIKHRNRCNNSLKVIEQQKTEIENLKKSEGDHPAVSELADRIKELEDSRKEFEHSQAELQALKENHTRAQNTIRAARNRIQAITSEKDQVNKEVDELKLEKEKLTSEQTSLKLRLNLLQDKCDADAKKHLTTIAKLQAQLKEKTTRRKVVVSKVPASAHVPSQSIAPTAAVKPTVTTTPTASIRPMGIQTTSAPTAHVTPTMVTTQHLIPSTTVTQLPSTITSVSSNTTAAATVFVRSTSPQIVTPLPNTVQGVEPPQSSTTSAVLGTVTASTASSIDTVISTQPSQMQHGAVVGASVQPMTSTSSLPHISMIPSTIPASSSFPIITSSAVSMPMSSTGTVSTVVSSLITASTAGSSLSVSHLVSSNARVASLTSSVIPSAGVSLTASQPLVVSSSASATSVTPQVATVSASGVGPSRGGVVVGNVGSTDGEKWSAKRKRSDEDDGGDNTEEPGSSLEPPSSKKRHIRLRQRVIHVSASTSQAAADTQGSSMDIIAKVSPSKDLRQPLDTSPVSQDSSLSQVTTIAEATQDSQSNRESHSPEESSQGQASSAPMVVVESAPISTASLESGTVQATPIQGVVSSLAPQQVTVSSEGMGVVKPVETLARISSSSESAKLLQLTASQDTSSSTTSPLMITSSDADVLQVSGQQDVKELSSDILQTSPSDLLAGSTQQSDSRLSTPQSHVDSSESLGKTTESQHSILSGISPLLAVQQEVGGVADPKQVDEGTEKGEAVEESEEKMEEGGEEEGEEEVGAVDGGPNGQEEATMELADSTQMEDVKEMPEPASEMMSDNEEEEEEEEEEEDGDGIKEVATKKTGEEQAEEQLEDEKTSREEDEVIVEETEEEDDEEEEEVDEIDEDVEIDVDQPRAVRHVASSQPEYDNDVIVIGSDTEEEDEEDVVEVEDEDYEEEEEEEDDDDEEEEEDELSGGDNQEDDDEDGDGVGGNAEGTHPSNGSVGGDDSQEDQEEGSHDQDGGEPPPSGQVDGSVHGQPPRQEHPLTQSSSVESEQGLPEDETSIDIQPSSVQAPPFRPTSFSSSRRLAVHFGERQTSIPGVDVHVGDSVVPHTPILSEQKQLAMTSQRAYTPSDQPAYVVPQLAESSLAAVSVQATGAIQSLGEQEIDFVPVPVMVVQASSVPQDLASVSSLDRGSEHSRDDPGADQQQDEDGDVNDSLIEEMVRGDASSEEEGEITEEDESSQPVMVPTTSFTRQLRSSSSRPSSHHSSPTPSSSLFISPSKVEREGSVGVTQSQETGVSTSDSTGLQPSAKKVKPSPIVWGQPSSSSIVDSTPSSQTSGGRSGRKLIRPARRGSGAQASSSRRNIRLKGASPRM